MNATETTPPPGEPQVQSLKSEVPPPDPIIVALDFLEHGDAEAAFDTLVQAYVLDRRREELMRLANLIKPCEMLEAAKAELRRYKLGLVVAGSVGA